jgi:quinolinate synthase
MVASLEYSPELALAVASAYERVKSVIPEVEWPLHAPYVAAINDLKVERRAVVLAHNYQTPEIFHCVADLTGDSLALAQRAAETDAEVIVLAGVHFMAETAKLLNPAKTVLIPDLRAGCSLAESVTAQDVRKLRLRYPDAPVVTYVNTSAEVKAESDICCTSGTAVQGVESLGASFFFRMNTSPLTSRSRPKSTSSPGGDIARCTNGSRPRSSRTIARPTTSWSSSRIPSARPTCSR